jgi:CspA family cold shock protein
VNSWPGTFLDIPVGTDYASAQVLNEGLGRPAARAALALERRRFMATGTVKWFNDAKGFGFITQDGGGEDVFCHHSAINMDGFRTLQEGQKVQFEVTKGPKGLQAQNVRAV